MYRNYKLICVSISLDINVIYMWRNKMKLKKKRSKSVKKTIFMLCLTLTMVFYNHIPVFAQDYVLNPGLEQGDVIDKNLMNQTVWAGYDTFSAIDGYREDQGSVKSRISVKLYEFTSYADDDVVSGEFESTIYIPVFDKISKEFVFPDDERYSDIYDSDDTIRAYTIKGQTYTKKSDHESYEETLFPLDTYRIVYHIGDSDYKDGYYIAGEEKTVVSEDELEQYDMTIPENATFLGWYDNPDFEGNPVTAISEDDQINGSIDLYAKLDYEEYKITYNLNGGEFVQGYVPVESYTENDEVILPNEDNVSKDASRFMGWYEDENFEGNAVTVISEGSTGDKNFYAYFKTINYEVESPDDYTIGSDEERTFHILDADMENLISVEWDGEKLDPSDYSVTSGSTKVTFSADFLDEKEIGEHKFKANFTDGYAESAINILEPEEDTDAEKTDSIDDKEETVPDAEVKGGDEKTVSEDETDNTNVDESVKTGDDTELLLATLCMFMGLAGVVVVSFLKKKRYSGR